LIETEFVVLAKWPATNWPLHPEVAFSQTAFRQVAQGTNTRLAVFYDNALTAAGTEGF